MNTHHHCTRKYSELVKPGQQLDLFDRFPHHPWCAHSLLDQGTIVPLLESRTYEFIKPNIDGLVLNIPFAMNGGDTTIDKPPSWFALAPSGARYVGYGLATPVRFGCAEASSRAMKYLAAVEAALADQLQATPCGSDWAANPLHTRGAILRGPWSLRELASGLDLKRFAPRRIAEKKLATTGFGRNVSLFHRARHWAYAAFLSGRYSFCEHFASTVFDHVEQCNREFDSPLGLDEVTSISRSISTWTWTNYRPQSRQETRGRDGHGKTRHLDYANGVLVFSSNLPGYLPPAEVKRRQAMAGKRSAEQEKLRCDQRIAAVAYAGMSVRQIASAAGVSLDKAARWKREQA